ncbi:MAG: hypothetical protein K6T87_16555 [Roseiflexus sp.]|jgi:hypothetical protein|uniref:hypothetical protein n=1 Tax=Roseiflexus sp. TaxID=2562120 RepID=UPI0025E4CFFD|nr:hypothetical protein [Roseiflexus sp.]MCL6542169.1 hypothetical protein [Roseiflexus sp.]
MPAVTQFSAFPRAFDADAEARRRTRLRNDDPIVIAAAPDCSDATPARRCSGAALFGRGMPRPDGHETR